MDERNNMERRSNNFLRSRDWSQSDGKIIYLESYVSCLRGSGWGGASAFQSWVRAPLARSWRNPWTVHCFPNIGLIKQSNTQCPRRHQEKKGKQYNHPRPLNDQNVKKFLIKFTCTNPRIVSAEQDVDETFTLQLLSTLFPYPLIRIEFSPPKFFSKTFRFSMIFCSTLQIFGGGHFRKACRFRKKESKQSEITCKQSEPTRTISKIEKRREFVRALC